MTDNNDIHLTDEQAKKVRQIAEEVGAFYFEEINADGQRRIDVILPPDDETQNQAMRNHSVALSQRLAQVQRENDNTPEAAALAIIAADKEDTTLAAAAQEALLELQS